MQPRWRTVPLAVFALALGGCGEEDGEETEAREAAPVPAPRCEPVPARTRTIEPRARWQVGDRRELTIERARVELAGSGETKARSTGSIEVTGKTAGGWLLRYEPDGLVLPPAEGALDQEVPEEVRDIFEGLAVEYSTDRAGLMNEVENVADVRERLKELLDEAEEDAEGDPQLTQALRATRRIALSEAFVQTVIVSDIVLLHDLYGASLTEGRPVRAEGELPNPFGGDPFPADIEIALRDARTASGCALFDTAVAPDRRAFAAAVRDVVAETGGDPAELHRFKLRHTARSSYDPGSGWFVRVESTERIDVAGGGQIDRTTVTLR
jgi:hypothetical protein